MTPFATLIVPGLRDHVADHWQTHLAARLPNAHTVPPLDHDKLNLAARVEALSKAIAAINGPVIICAHSAGVLITTHWAQQATRPVQGALLACPPDLETPMPTGYPTLDELGIGGWLPVPRQPLPFPSLVLGSENDPLAALDRTAELAKCWSADFRNLGAVGHLNPASGHGEWPEVKTLLAELSLART